MPGTRPLTRAQQLENRAFLRELRRTGNAREAARAVGAHRAKFTKRRAKHPAFAQAWEAALVVAHAALQDGRGGPKKGHQPTEPRITRTAAGTLQLRRAQPGRLDRGAEQRFLAALSASANVRLAAKAAGFSHASFYQRKRTDPAFAREWGLALAEGYERLEMALLESALPKSFEHDDWRRNDPPAIPPMTAEQALQLLYLHQKEAKLGSEHVLLRRLSPGETHQARSMRLALMYEDRQAREREAFRIAEAERLARGEPTRAIWAPGELPDLSQVTGWSKAKGEPPHDARRALFGGWRLGDIEKKG